MTRASAPGYDLFKLLVTIVLVVILLLMLLGGGATSSAPVLPAENATTAPTQDASGTSPTATSVVPAVTDSPTSSSALPTSTLAPTPTPAAAKPTSAVEPTGTTSLSATSTPSKEATTPALSAGGNADCNTSAPSRLSVGQEAQVAQRLNMRSDPLITAPILQTNQTDTRVEIIGGPVCTPVGKRAYLWWQIRLADGTEGWSAETQLNEPSYLLAPVP